MLIIRLESISGLWLSTLTSGMARDVLKNQISDYKCVVMA